MRVPTLAVLLAMLLVLLAAAPGMAPFGDPDAPASQHVARYYLEHAYHDAHTPNVVTVMIADYRSFDTLGETMVVFAAGIACTLLLLPRGARGRVPLLLHRKVNLIAEVVVRVMLPAVQIFAF
jgi:multicomponent Na+:H+ antiporter subunit B